MAPAEVFDDLVEHARLGPGARLLEIGCGTGQATLPLAERGFSILAVELGANLAEAGAAEARRVPDVEIVTSSFEDWDPGASSSTPSSPSTRSTGSTPIFASRSRQRAEARRLARRVRLGLRRPRRRGPDVVDSCASRTKRSQPGSRHGTSTTCATGRRSSRRAGTSAPSPEGRTSAIYVQRRRLRRAGRNDVGHRALEDDVREDLFERMRRRIEDGGGSTVVRRGLDVLYVATVA